MRTWSATRSVRRWRRGPESAEAPETEIAEFVEDVVLTEFQRTTRARPDSIISKAACPRVVEIVAPAMHKGDAPTLPASIRFSVRESGETASGTRTFVVLRESGYKMHDERGEDNADVWERKYVARGGIGREAFVERFYRDAGLRPLVPASAMRMPVLGKRHREEDDESPTYPGERLMELRSAETLRCEASGSHYSKPAVLHASGRVTPMACADARCPEHSEASEAATAASLKLSPAVVEYLASRVSENLRRGVYERCAGKSREGVTWTDSRAATVDPLTPWEVLLPDAKRLHENWGGIASEEALDAVAKALHEPHHTYDLARYLYLPFEVYISEEWRFHRKGAVPLDMRTVTMTVGYNYVAPGERLEEEVEADIEASHYAKI
ncbi:hypothetical protein CYMTET_13681 [Cymbomonas tetramitiformis]|nr:hypothetical protein CYMTET_13681 [Cymbomonas tetramitiformis]